MEATRTGFNPEYSEAAPSLEQIESLTGPAVLEFGAPWCGYCIGAAPAVKQALRESAMPHIKVYDGKGKRLGRAFKVKLWPTLIFLKDGEEMARVVRPRGAHEVTEALRQTL